MRRILPLLFFSTLILNSLSAQTNYNTLSGNKKNAAPYKGYWQQDVAYDIDARIDETNNQITAKESLTYTNNSPDTLHFVYFHLYQNAFVKGSYLHQLEKANKVAVRMGKYEAAGLGITIANLTGNGHALKTELDNTILKVYLHDALLPGKSIVFQMDFHTYFDKGATRRRMQMYNAWGFMHYNGCQWYPKLCVYDAKFGWNTDQHLGREFYGDFGTFKVSLDFASNYVVEATGELQNRKEVLPDALRKQLDISNFAGKPWNEKPSIITPYDKDSRKKWVFYAENVHDFAFTADPSYRLASTYWNGIECVAIAQEPHASGWQDAAELVAKTVQTFSENYGMFEYPKMVAADAGDGMEYPMITMDGGRSPGYGKLLVHEIGHNWFYGMIGSNETYRASLDEGFTQFLTSEGLRKIFGDTLVTEEAESAWKRTFDVPVTAIDANVYSRYMLEIASGRDHQLNTHSDDFNSALGHGGGYGLVYFKTATMLYDLQYTLGDSLFAAAMKHYVAQWKFAHPYFDDFRNSIIQFTHQDLNWFFDQWLETTKDLDYSIRSVHKVKHTDSFDITFKRKGQMQMPLDFSVYLKDGSIQNYHIPNGWFRKQTSATTLSQWTGWGKLNTCYTARIPATSGIRQVLTDTTHRLADRYMTDNYYNTGIFHRRKAITVKWDPGYALPQDWKHYQLFIRPDLWYNAIDGIKPGLHWEGSYMGLYGRTSGAIWFNTQLGQWNRFDNSQIKGIQKWLNYTFNYSSPIALSMPSLTFDLHSRYLDGLWNHNIGLSWDVDPRNTIRISFQEFYRNKGYTAYLLYPDEWSSDADRRNSNFTAGYTRTYKNKTGLGSLSLTARMPLLSKHFDYSYLEAEWKHTQLIDRLLLRTRAFARYGIGNNVPNESALFLAGASPEEMMDNKFVRSVAFVPDEWTGSYSIYETGHFQYGGGLNLRGYAGYMAVDRRNGKDYIAYKGRSGAAINAELDFSRYIKLRPAFTRKWLRADLYAFADAGIISLSRLNTDNTLSASGKDISDLRIDAGVGTAFTVYKWGVFNKAAPWTIRFDMPVFINRPPLGAAQYFGARWLIGISRAF